MEKVDSKRFRAPLPVAFARDGYPGEIRGLVFNLSSDGCMVTSDARVSPGAYLTLRLYLPAPHEPVAVQLATVRWAMERDFGVMFLNVESEELRRLNRFLAELEPTDATR